MSNHKSFNEDENSEISEENPNLLELFEREQMKLATGAATIDRRKFLRIASSILTAPIVRRSTELVTTGAVGAVLSTQLYRSLDDHAKKEEEIKRSREIFFNEILGGTEDLSFIPSVNNPYSQLKGPTFASMAAIQETIRFLNPGSHSIVDYIHSDVSHTNGHIMLFGGPLANIYTRQIFGHAGKSPLLSLVNSDVCCRFENLFSCNNTRPAYSLSVNGRSHFPQKGRDFLLLTRLPNVFSTNYGMLEDSIFIVSGLHGYGTRSIKSLLSKPEYIKEIHQKTRNLGGAWQIILVVRHGDENAANCILRTTAKAFPIEADFDRLRSLMEKRSFFLHRDDPCFEALRP